MKILNDMMISKKSIFILILFLNIFNYSFSQNIKGYLVDTNDMPVEYATIQLLQKDSLVSATISDSTGYFILDSKKLIGNEHIKLSISCVGFIPENISSKYVKRNMGRIKMKDDIKLLQTVEIKKEIDKRKILSNKTILRVDSNLSKTSVNAIEYLDKIPEIIINKRTKNISIAGKSGEALVLINGALSDASDLSTIRPEEIERIEIIKNSSIKYGAETNGVVNIILKKRKTGYTIDTKIDYSTNQRDMSPYINLRYTREKISYFFYYGFGYNNNISTTYSEATYNKLHSSFDKYRDNEEYKILKKTHNLKYGIDIFINKNNILKITGRNKYFNNNGNGILNSRTIKNDTIVNNYISNNNWAGNTNNHNYSLFYKHIFKNKSELLLDYNFYLFEGDFNDYYTDRTDVTSDKKESNHIRINCNKEISKKISLEMGYDFYSRNLNNSFNNSTFSRSLDFLEYRNSAFVQGNFNLSSKLSTNFGFRYEYSDITLYANNKKDINVILPTFSVLYKINKKNSFNFSLNEELNYPTYSQLEPFPFYSGDSLYYIVGNPYLKPEQTYYLNMDYNLFISNSFYFTQSVFYNPTKDIIGSIKSIENNNILKEVYQNVSISYDKGVSLSLTYKPISMWYINLFSKVGHYEIASNSDSNSGYSYSLFLYNQLSFPKDISFGLSIMINPKTYELQGYTEPNFYIPSDIYISKLILKGNGSIILGWAFPFNDFENNSYYKDNEFEMYSKSNYTFQCVYATFTYSLFKGKNKKIDRENLYEDDTEK